MAEDPRGGLAQPGRTPSSGCASPAARNARAAAGSPSPRRTSTCASTCEQPSCAASRAAAAKSYGDDRRGGRPAAHARNARLRRRTESRQHARHARSRRAGQVRRDPRTCSDGPCAIGGTTPRSSASRPATATADRRPMLDLLDDERRPLRGAATSAGAGDRRPLPRRDARAAEIDARRARARARRAEVDATSGRAPIVRARRLRLRARRTRGRARAETRARASARERDRPSAPSPRATCARSPHGAPRPSGALGR